ncbi:MAG TPA: mechanosensitive ion channel family protein [Gemmatimonadales bacterium]|nr:mechanosensitive ion channel family protein [Gemmatimonadales bacterium]
MALALLIQAAPQVGKAAMRAVQADWTVLLPELAALVIGGAVLFGIRRMADRRLRRPGELATGIDDLVLELVRSTGLGFLFFLVLTIAPSLVAVPSGLRPSFHVVAVLALLVQLAFWGNGVITWFTRRQMIRGGASRPVAVTALTALGFAARLILILLLVLVGLANLGINVTALLTTLGVAGVAVALALQSVLSDLIGALSIVLNRPFLVGETIQSGEFLGTVEYVGLRTTRIRNLSGEELFLPNSYLLNNAIRNLSRLEQRRVSLGLRISYQTTLERLEEIPEIVAEIVRQTPDARFDRAHLKSFGDWGYEYEVVWYATTPDFTRYMDARQRINLAVLRQLQGDGVLLGAPARGTVPAPAHADVVTAVGRVYGSGSGE